MSTISTSTTITQETLTTFPITISGGTSTTQTVITLGGNITLDSGTKYFIIGSAYVTFNGAGYTVTTNGITNYPGLIRNGTGTDAYSNITVQNVGFVTTDTIQTSGGWIGQRYFGKNATPTTAVLINNCYSTGSIQSSAGGIIGGNSSGSVNNCYSTGRSYTGSGGITGYQSSANATNCYSTGTIGNEAGGITGESASGNATNCYSTGTISSYGGGILGRGSSGNATNCYSTGTISINAGGITGYQSSGNATNCYTTGTITTSGNGIRGTSSTTTITTCASTNGAVWTNSEANTVLTNYPTYSAPTYTNGSVWTNVTPASNAPYKLTTFNTSPYTLSSKTISYGSAGGNSGSNTDLGTYSIVAVKPSTTNLYSTTYSYISINSGSGQLTFTSGLSASTTYTILVYVYNSVDGYTISDYVLTVDVVCFLEGTKLRTPSGYELVENLKNGDKLVTTNFITVAETAITKIIKFTVTGHDKNLPYRIKKDKCGQAKPFEDLYLSRGHAYYTVKQTPVHVHHSNKRNYDYVGKPITYYSIETVDFENDIIFANGLEVETCAPNRNYKRICDPLHENCVLTKKSVDEIMTAR